MNIQILHNLVELCARKGIRNAVLCPGSRSAPLTLAFARNKNIKCRTFSDERSAAFVALGIAQQTKAPVVLVCTSGSAGYNFAPAVAEAFFQQIPLIVFTADRPTEWIDQFDGQTIRQKNLFGNHVKKYFELPIDYTHPDDEWYGNRIVNEAVNLSQSGIKGPVQINAPFREPLYPPFPSTNFTEAKDLRITESLSVNTILSDKDWTSLCSQLSEFTRVLIVSGQNEPDEALIQSLAAVSVAHHWPIAGDMLSNLHSIPDFCGHTDTFLATMPEAEKKVLQPDLLITFGKSLVTKHLKLFLRKFQPREHWHIQIAGDVADTFQSLTRIIPTTPLYFFSELVSTSFLKTSTGEFRDRWLDAEQKAKQRISMFFKPQPKGEFRAVHKIIESLPESCVLHLANSMTVRYANHIGLTAAQKDISVFCNRGTSGIDGCTSTAVGHALSTDRPVVLITGDLAFFYDRNAFWHNYPLPNLFVIVLNNHGGIIFNLIDGPSGQPEAEEFFITRQKLGAGSLASEFDFSFTDNTNDLKAFFKSDKNVKILEIESSQSENKKIFEEFKKMINQRL